MNSYRKQKKRTIYSLTIGSQFWNFNSWPEKHCHCILLLLLLLLSSFGTELGHSSPGTHTHTNTQAVF